MKNFRSYLIAVLIMLFTFCSFAPVFAVVQGDEEAGSSTEEESRNKIDEKSEEKSDVRKVVYLTFDDGPTKNTLKNLEILKEEGVTATFFVIGELVEQSPDILLQAHEDGHEICIHTYNHKNKNYQSKAAFLDDYNKAVDAVTNVLGHEPSKFMRMPGGSSTRATDKYTLKSIRDELCDEGIYYVDWNVSLEDAICTNIPVDTLLRTFRKELKKTYIDSNNIIVLMHDGASNSTTPQALPAVIKYFKENNYEFKNFGELTQEEFDKLLSEKQINKYNQPKQADSTEMKANPASECESGK